MTIPQVSGWMIDFRTARDIFSSGSNNRISHCVELASKGQLGITHCEEKQFRSVPALKDAFIEPYNCVIMPDASISDRCRIISNRPVCKNLVIGNNSAIFIAAVAAVRNYGVISNHSSNTFSTVIDVCTSIGVHAYSADSYFQFAT